MTCLVRDEALPALAQALDIENLTPALEQAVGLSPGQANTLRWSPEVLKHKPGQRCTILYRLVHSEAASDSRNATVGVIGKVYRRRRLAERTFGRVAGLKHAFVDDGARTCIPAPLALVQDIGLILQQYIDAPDLRHSIADDTINNTREGPLALCAQWLATLHDTLPLPGLKRKPIEHELALIDRWCDEIVCRLPDGGQRLRLAQQALHDRAHRMAQFASAMIHRDFYYMNALWDGQRLWILDFDQISLGDPALDVGHFIAHLESLSYRTTGQSDAFMSAANCFLESYLETRPSNIRSRVTFYKAYTFLKLAATEIGKRRNGPDPLTCVLAGLALRAVNALSDVE